MAFNTSMTSQSQTNPTDNINTRGIQFYNGDATIVFDYWNGMASIKIHPALPEAERANKQVYDYKKSVSVALSPDNAVLVGKYIKEDIFSYKALVILLAYSVVCIIATLVIKNRRESK